MLIRHVEISTLNSYTTGLQPGVMKYLLEAVSYISFCFIDGFVSWGYLFWGKTLDSNLQ